MTLTVSVSELRNNISGYLERVLQGTRVLVRDEKRNITIAQIKATTTFDKQMYERALQKAAGIFSEEKHLEWKTQTDTSNWVQKNRLQDERSF